jgi:hypothetical protein
MERGTHDGNEGDEAKAAERVRGRRSAVKKRANNPESWACIDCGYDTAPGMLSKSQMCSAISMGFTSFTYTVACEVYIVTAKVWRQAGAPDGCLCIGCLETRVGRQLGPKDFDRQHDYAAEYPCTARLRSRRTGIR